MRRSLFIILGLAVMSLGMYVTSWAQTGTSPTDIEKLVAGDAEFIQKTLGKENLAKDKKSQRRIRLASLMIAQYAQSGIAKGNLKNGSLAALRDQALAVREAVDKGEFGNAKKLAEKLSVNIATNAKASQKPIDLVKLEEFDNIMSQFSSARLGGFNMEDYLEELATLKNDPNAADAEKIQLYAKKVSMIAALAEAHTPAMLGGAKTLDAWKTFAKTMHKDALELSTAAEGKKASSISKAAVKLNDACKSCHDVFR